MMAKRGETRPWLVEYRWENGVKGRASYADRELAEIKAQQIRDASELRDMTVAVTVRHRDES